MAVQDWDETVDVVIVGSGAAGLLASIVAVDAGLNPLVIEKAALWGGTSALSGGGLWIPNNALMEADEAEDSLQEALKYMEAVIEDVGPASSLARKCAYLENAPRMMEFAASKGFEWIRARYYPDYYPDTPGSRIGRVVEGRIYNGKLLGDWLKTLRPRTGIPPMAIKSDDVYLLPLMTRTWAGFARTAKVVLDTLFWRLTGRIPLASGQSLVAQLMSIAQRHKVPVRLETALEDLVFEGGCVAGVVVRSGGQNWRIAAKKAVLLAAGGFARNDEFWKKYQPVGEQYTSASIDDTGDAIQIGMRAGAATTLMDAAWWGPSSVAPDGSRFFVLWERSLPHSIIVDSSGQRYTNESQSYVDAGADMIERNRSVPADPSWMIMDARHRRRYLFGTTPGGITPRAWIKQGYFVSAGTLDELAVKINVDAAGLRKTVARFNGFADTGVDLDFGRGANVYDNYYSDPRTRPNPNLGRIEKAPFWAVPIVAGDLGTKGGLLTDEHARVLTEGGAVIEGLYAAGNTTASLMGRTSPGPGSTLGPATTFAFIAIRHAAGKTD